MRRQRGHRPQRRGQVHPAQTIPLHKVQFKPVTAYHKDIESATEHNFDVKEASGVPTYESSKMTFNVDTHDYSDRKSVV